MRVCLYSVSSLKTGTISIMPRPRGDDWLHDELEDLHNQGVDVVVSLLTVLEEQELALCAEAQLCKEQQILYFSFPILDQSVPPLDSATYLFAQQLCHYVKSSMHIVIHCRIGLGRSALLAASILLLLGYTPDEAVAMLSHVRGYRVPETVEQRCWIERFYHTYAHDVEPM